MHVSRRIVSFIKKLKEILSFQSVLSSTDIYSIVTVAREGNRHSDSRIYIFGSVSMNLYDVPHKLDTETIFYSCILCNTCKYLACMDALLCIIFIHNVLVLSKVTELGQRRCWVKCCCGSWSPRCSAADACCVGLLLKPECVRDRGSVACTHTHKPKHTQTLLDLLHASL